MYCTVYMLYLLYLLNKILFTLSDNQSSKPLFGLLFEWPRMQGFTVCTCSIGLLSSSLNRNNGDILIFSSYNAARVCLSFV